MARGVIVLSFTLTPEDTDGMEFARAAQVVKPLMAQLPGLPDSQLHAAVMDAAERVLAVFEDDKDRG